MATWMRTSGGDVVLALSPIEAHGLRALTDEGGEGLLNDAAAAKAYIGNKAAIDAARRAMQAIKVAAMAARGTSGVA